MNSFAVALRRNYVGDRQERLPLLHLHIALLKRRQLFIEAKSCVADYHMSLNG